MDLLSDGCYLMRILGEPVSITMFISPDNKGEIFIASVDLEGINFKASGAAVWVSCWNLIGEIVKNIENSRPKI